MDALACGQAVLAGVTARNRDLRAAGEAPVAVGIGIHLGEVYCGTVGDAQRLEFTVLGDAVNVAARLEALTKVLDVPLLASDEVIQRAGSAAPDWHNLGSQVIYGRAGALSVHALARPPTE